MRAKGKLSNHLLQAPKASLMPAEQLFKHFPVLSLQVFHFLSSVYHTVIREATAIDALQWSLFSALVRWALLHVSGLCHIKS